MKFEVDSKELKGALAKVYPAVPPRTPMPVLECFKLQVAGDELTVTATDLEMALQTTLAIQGQEGGGALVPARLLNDLVSTLTGSILLYMEKEKLIVKAGSGGYRFGASKIDEYPEVNFDNQGVSLKLKAEDFTEGVNFSKISISEEDMRPAMSGLLLQFDGGNLKLVATNGHMLSIYQLGDVEDMKADLIIPKGVSYILSKFISTDIIELQPGANHLVIKSGNDLLHTRLIGEKYPAYESVIPKDQDKVLTVNREALLCTIKRMMAMGESKEMRAVIFNLSDNGLQVNFQSELTGNTAVETLECQSAIGGEGEPFKIKLNGQFLKTLLETFKSEDVYFEMAESNKAVIIRSEKKGVNLALLMPVKLDA